MSKQQMKIEFKSEGFQAILNSEGVRGLIEAKTEAVCGRANANLEVESVGYKSNVIQGNRRTERWLGFVYTTDHASMVAETEDKALSRAVSG